MARELSKQLAREKLLLMEGTERFEPLAMLTIEDLSGLAKSLRKRGRLGFGLRGTWLILNTPRNMNDPWFPQQPSVPYQMAELMDKMPGNDKDGHQGTQVGETNMQPPQLRIPTDGMTTTPASPSTSASTTPGAPSLSSMPSKGWTACTDKTVAGSSAGEVLTEEELVGVVKVQLRQFGSPIATHKLEQLLQWDQRYQQRHGDLITFMSTQPAHFGVCLAANAAVARLRARVSTGEVLTEEELVRLIVDQLRQSNGHVHLGDLGELLH